MARQEPQPQVIEPNDDLYVPVGIEELPREGAEPKAPKPKAGLKDSVGAKDLEFVKDNARHTLDGLRNFEWAGLFASLSNTAALAATAVLAAVSAYSMGGLGGILGLLGWLAGATALILFLLAVVWTVLGVWAAHLGKSELGILQRRQVERSERYLWRGVYALIPGAGVALVLAFQESTLYRDASIPYATVFSLAAGLVSAVVASRYFAVFLSEYLRNLTPKTGKRGRRRLRLGIMLSASVPIAVCLAGAPLLLLDYDQACTYYSQCPGDELWTLIAPSYGPPSHVTPHLAIYLPIPALLGSVVVAGLLALSRVCAVFTLGSYRRQVREAELLIRERIRLHAPEALPPG